MLAFAKESYHFNRFKSILVSQEMNEKWMVTAECRCKDRIGLFLLNKVYQSSDYEHDICSLYGVQEFCYREQGSGNLHLIHQIRSISPIRWFPIWTGHPIPRTTAESIHSTEQRSFLAYSTNKKACVTMFKHSDWEASRTSPAWQTEARACRSPECTSRTPRR